MAVNPVLLKDLRGNLFRRKPVIAVAYMASAILVLTLGVASLFPSWMIFQSNQPPLWRFPDMILPILAPAFAAGAFAKEYEQRTWQDLMLTRLHSREILWGKFFACLLPTLIAIVILFPPFAMLLILQDVKWALDPGPWMFVVLFKFIVSTVFYVSAVLLCSFYSHNFRTALVIGYVALAAYVVFNYAVWTFFLTPYFHLYMFAEEPFNLYGGISGAQNFDHSSEFKLSPLEYLHLIQSAVLACLAMAFLGSRITQGRTS